MRGSYTSNDSQCTANYSREVVRYNIIDKLLHKVEKKDMWMPWFDLYETSYRSQLNPKTNYE